MSKKKRSDKAELVTPKRSSKRDSLSVKPAVTCFFPKNVTFARKAKNLKEK